MANHPKNTQTIPRRAPALLAGAALVLLAGLSPAAALDSGERFEDWTVACEKPKDPAQTPRCFISQKILVKDNRQPILLIGAGLLGPDKRPAIILTVPLGVYLPGGLTLTVPDVKPMRLPFETCLPGGCRAGVVLNDELLAGLRKGDKAVVTLNDARRRLINLPISLKGLSRGFDAVLKQ
jgi:invasion protein IalB